MIIGISGYSGSGKDTIGLIIQYLLAKEGKPAIEDVIDFPSANSWWLEESSQWTIKKFAYKLKVIAEILTGIDCSKFEDQEFKNKTFKQLVEEGYMSQDVLNLLTKT